MAITANYSHQFMMEALRKEHDIESDALYIALMDTTFTFDPDTHATWADCSADEIANGFGYSTAGELMTNVAMTIDTTGNQVDISADNITWEASGGPIPTTGSAIIYNATHSNSTVVMGIDFDADYDTPDGKLFQINFSNGLGALQNT